MRRDQKKAEEQLRNDWLQQKRRMERKHRQALQEYVDTRLALAMEGARIKQLREQQLLQQRRRAMENSPAGGDPNHPSGNVPQSKDGVVSAWWPPQGTKPKTAPSSRSDPTEPIRQVVEEVSQRTTKILQGNDKLVDATQA